MLLAVDVGNTTTRVGVWGEEGVGHVSTAPTGEVGDPASAAALAEEAVRAAGAEMGEVAVALCSVVPGAEKVWREWAGGEGGEVFVVRGDTPTPLSNRYRDPERLGGDRLAAAVGAVRRLGSPVVVVSLGTATMVDAVSAEQEFLGGVIVVGVQSGLDALAERTAALPRVSAGSPLGVVGRETEECLRAGAVLGTAALVEGLTERMREEVGGKAPLVVTGGNAELVSRYLRVEHEVAPTLVLDGAAAVWEHNRGKGG